MKDPRLEKIMVHFVGYFSNGQFSEIEEFFKPQDTLEYYVVTLLHQGQEIPLAKFWLCNNYSDAIHMLVPMDVLLLEYIQEEMHNRSMKRDWASEFPEKFSSESA